jgi:hypothetical protein
MIHALSTLYNTAFFSYISTRAGKKEGGKFTDRLCVAKTVLLRMCRNGKSQTEYGVSTAEMIMPVLSNPALRITLRE